MIIYVTKKIGAFNYLDNIISLQDPSTQCADASMKKNDADGVPGRQL